MYKVLLYNYPLKQLEHKLSFHILGLLLIVGHNQICYLATFDVTEKVIHQGQQQLTLLYM